MRGLWMIYPTDELNRERDLKRFQRHTYIHTYSNGFIQILTDSNRFAQVKNLK